MTRRIMVSLHSRRTYTRDEEITPSFRANFLGALLTLLSAGLEREKELDRTTSSHRLADFALFGEAVSLAVGNPPGHFDKLYGHAKTAASRDYAAGDDFVTAVVALLKGREAKAVVTDEMPKANQIRKACEAIIKSVSGTHIAAFTKKGLLKGSREMLASTPHGFHGKSAVPGSERQLTGAVRRLTPILADLGIEVAEKPLGSPARRENVFVFRWREIDN
jgi:hypothetical protein